MISHDFAENGIILVKGYAENYLQSSEEKDKATREREEYRGKTMGD